MNVLKRMASIILILALSTLLTGCFSSDKSDQCKEEVTAYIKNSLLFDGSVQGPRYDKIFIGKSNEDEYKVYTDLDKQLHEAARGLSEKQRDDIIGKILTLQKQAKYNVAVKKLDNDDNDNERYRVDITLNVLDPKMFDSISNDIHQKIKQKFARQASDSEVVQYEHDTYMKYLNNPDYVQKKISMIMYYTPKSTNAKFLPPEESDYFHLGKLFRGKIIPWDGRI